MGTIWPGSRPHDEMAKVNCCPITPNSVSMALAASRILSDVVRLESSLTASLMPVLFSAAALSAISTVSSTTATRSYSPTKVITTSNAPRIDPASNTMVLSPFDQ